jgi:hypothetical protein
MEIFTFTRQRIEVLCGGE